jgi:hypothetical protein
MRILRPSAGLAVIVVAALAATVSTASSAYASQASGNRPGLANVGGTEWVAWAGTDSPSHLNIDKLAHVINCNTGCGDVITDTVEGGTGPALTNATIPGTSGGQIIVAWAGTDNPTHIYVGHDVPGNTTLGCHTRLPEATGNSPYLVGAGGNIVYLVWTGLDAARHLNIVKLDTSQCTNIGGQITEVSGSKVTLNDTSVSGPAVTIFHGGIYLAWSGTDSNHHIYTGQFVGSQNLANHTCLCSYESQHEIGLANSTLGTVSLAYTGTDKVIRVAASTNGFTYPSQQTVCTPVGFGSVPATSNAGPDVDSNVNVAYTGTDSVLTEDSPGNC